MSCAPAPQPRDLDARVFRLRLREARGDRTQAAVAALVGLSSRQALQAYEYGRVVPTIDLCERLAAALGVAPAWLAGWE